LKIVHGLFTVGVGTHDAVAISDLCISILFREIEAETPAIVKINKTGILKGSRWTMD
jgi:hypothetical protein